jgi:hypothetical protein
LRIIVISPIGMVRSQQLWGAGAPPHTMENSQRKPIPLVPSASLRANSRSG